MNIFEKFYYTFKRYNPNYTNIKFIIVIGLILFFLGNSFLNFRFSWELLIGICVLIVSMTFHEVAHGYVAYKFGDDTAKNQGRLTLNPLKHLELKGLILPLLLYLVGSPILIGSAKPVPVAFWKLKPNRLGLFSVAIAGIVVNLIIATICGIVLRMLSVEEKIVALTGDGNLLILVLFYGYIINLGLAFFNLIPITPLDGGRIVHSLSGRKVRDFYDTIEPYGIVILIGILYLVSEFPIIDSFFENIFIFFIKLVIGVEIPLY